MAFSNLFFRYSIGGSLNPANGEIQLFCTDPIDSCLRARCECDVHLANNLRKFEHEWNMNNHHKACFLMNYIFIYNYIIPDLSPIFAILCH